MLTWFVHQMNFETESLNILRKFSRKTRATQSMLLIKFFSKYLKNIIMQQMVLIIVTIISMTAIYLPWILNQRHLRNSRYLPYPIKVKKETMKLFKKEMKKMFSSNVKPRIVSTGRKVGTSFQIKDQIKMKHKHDIVYCNECPEEQCNKNYIGKTWRRISERIIDHAGRDSKSYVYKHYIETGHRSPDINYFRIIGSNFRKNLFKRKIAEALLIKQLKPTLNKQEKAIELKLFNWHHVYAGFSD